MLHFHLQIVCENCAKLSVSQPNGLPTCLTCCHLFPFPGSSWVSMGFPLLFRLKRRAFSSTSTTADNESPPLLDSRKIFVAITETAMELRLFFFFWVT